MAQQNQSWKQWKLTAGKPAMMSRRWTRRAEMIAAIGLPLLSLFAYLIAYLLR